MINLHNPRRIGELVFLDFQEVRELEVEISSRCNAACPMCARNQSGGKVKPSLRLSDWELSWVDQIFDPRFVNLKLVAICGCYGDPATARHAIEIVERIQSKTNAAIEFYSNGSIRAPDWWERLGKLLKRKSFYASSHHRKTDLAIFSVDGLSDTNAIYRRHTNFEKIMANATAFIKAGGFARWDYLVFKHNEHQVNEAQALAQAMGFKEFRIRKTSRFATSPDGPNRFRVLNDHGEHIYDLRPPEREEFKNVEIQKFEQLKNSKPGLIGYLDQTSIQCLYKTTFRRLYVNATGHGFPCCYLGNDFEPATRFLNSDFQKKFLNRYEENFNHVATKGWSEVLAHPFFMNELEQSWTKPLTDGRLVRCGRTCGQQYSPILSQSQDVALTYSP